MDKHAYRNVPGLEISMVTENESPSMQKSIKIQRSLCSFAGIYFCGASFVLVILGALASVVLVHWIQEERHFTMSIGNPEVEWTTPAPAWWIERVDWLFDQANETCFLPWQPCFCDENRGRITWQKQLNWNDGFVTWHLFLGNCTLYRASVQPVVRVQALVVVGVLVLGTWVVALFCVWLGWVACRQSLLKCWQACHWRCTSPCRSECCHDYWHVCRQRPRKVQIDDRSVPTIEVYGSAD